MTTPLSTGTISVTNGSAAVAGSGTNWLVSGITAGDILIVYATAGREICIVGVDAVSDTSLTLSANYEGATEAGLSYDLVRFFGSDNAADAYRRINEIVDRLDSVPENLVDHSGSGVPSDALGEDGETYLNIANGDLYLKAAGTWGAALFNITGPQGDPGTGYNSQGPWDSVTNWSVDDVVSHQGSSYAALLASTNIEPGVHASWQTYWLQIAAKGDAGDAGNDGFMSGYSYAFSTTITDADPGAGVLRFNHATFASVTQIFADNNDGNAADITSFLDGLDDSTNANHKGYLRIEKVGDDTIYREFVVTGTVVDGTGYRKLPVSPVAEAGALADTNNIKVTFRRTGDKGTDGAGAGDVVGPASATSGNFASYGSATGKLIADSGFSSASFATAAQGVKVDFLTVTGNINLDTLNTRVNALDAAVIIVGGWDASAGTFPGGGTAQAGESYQVTVAGTVDGVDFSINDRIIALLDNASTSTYASNWLKADYSDLVPSVVGLTGAISKSGLLAALNVEDGAQVNDAETLKADTDDELTAGYSITDNDLGNKSSAYTPAYTDRNMPSFNNNGAFQFNAPTVGGNYTMIIQVTNTASAGAITFAGFTIENTAAITTTSGDDFFFHIVKHGSFTSIYVEALQ